MNLSLYARVFGPIDKNLGTRTMKVDRAFDAGTDQQILEKGMMVPIDLEGPPRATNFAWPGSTTRHDSSALSAARLDNRLCRRRPAVVSEQERHGARRVS